MDPPPVHITELASVLYIHTTLYIANGWHCTLHGTQTSHLFPLLVNNIIYGSQIGNPPPLQHTFFPTNLPSALKLPHIIDDKISSELAANRMSGPFTIDKHTSSLEATSTQHHSAWWKRSLAQANGE